MLLKSPLKKYKRPVMPTQRWDLLPAPVKGLDVTLPFSDQDPRTGLILENVICRRVGIELRGGAGRWTTNLGGAVTPSPVRTLAGYLPQRGTGSLATAKLFAFCENEKVYDVTSQTNEATVPASVLTLAGQIEPGYASHVNFAGVGINYLLVVIPGVGYYTYDHAGGWVDRTASVTGVTPGLANAAFVMIWKKRIWFIIHNDTRAYYLPAGNITGAASEFDFGAHLAHGGTLQTLSSWTRDSGEGIDDNLVAVGSGGDVIVYAGTDPAAAATFGSIGRWYIGPPPSGRRFATKYGGDLGLICENGIEFMSRLVNAQGLLDPDGEQVNGATRRYNEVIAKDVRNTRQQLGWSAIHTTSEDCVVIVTPHNASRADSLQYCFSTVPAAWSTFSGIQAAAAEFFNGNLFVGTPNGTVQRMFDTDTDDELTDGTPGFAFVGSIQTAFIAPNDDRMRLKTPVLVQPMFNSTEPPSIAARVNTEWSSEDTSGVLILPTNDNALWDLALWDQAVWGGSDNTYLVWVGCSGLGCYFSLRLSIVGKPRTLFTSWKVIYLPGALM
jgi:hypothetical protein